MAKKPQKVEEEERRIQRQSRKEYLRSQRESEQRRRVYLALGGVGALLILVFVFALVNEFVLAPNRAVATINGEDISLGDWENRVRYERAQRIILLENQYDAFDGNVGLIQQFAGQQINELLLPEELGQQVIDLMVNEAVIRQEAETRGITVTDAEVDAAIEESFAYYNGDVPTPRPTATATVMPTPSLTPIPTAVITEEVPINTPLPTVTAGPTSTPQPTATAVSLDSFQEQLGDLIGEFEALGIDESVYRTVVRANLYQEKLTDALAEDAVMPTEAEHASLYVISVSDEAEANDIVAQIESEEFLTLWNTIRSAALSPEQPSTASAFEVLWRRQDELESLGTAVASAAFSLPLNTTSDLLVNVDEASGQTTYYIVQVSGREVRELTQSAIDADKRQNLISFLDSQIADNLVLTEFWRNRVPTQPLLDPKFTVPPTPDPAQLITPEAGQ